MKKYIPHSLLDNLNWQKIKFNNRPEQQEKILQNWINNGKQAPTPHIVKQTAIKFFQNKFNINVLIETGTFRGEMIYAQRNNFNKIISIELSKELFEIARKRFKDYKNVEIINGNSGEIFESLIIKINEPAIFWLDGHYSGFETAKGDMETPIMRELQFILESKINHIILIDDARLFTGKNDYPAKEELQTYIFAKKNNYNFVIEDDVIRAFP